MQRSETEEPFQDHTGRRSWVTSGSQAVPARSLGCHLALALVGQQHCIHPHPPAEFWVRVLIFPLEAQELQHGERSGRPQGQSLAHSPCTRRWSGTRLFAPRLRSKQDPASQVTAAAALAKNTFFFSTIQTITGPYHLLSKIKHSPGAMHYAGSRAVCNHLGEKVSAK